ncbi:hypothetical protein AHF37_01473 [Paragonimus kellicotti]|nr:hypothetical protein AHF37_01473 [Paragonimus kellicotti]
MARTNRRARVRLDKRLLVEHFKVNLANRLRLSPQSVHMDVCFQHRVLQKDFDQLQPSDTLQVTIDPKLESGTMKLDLRVLDLTGLRIPSCEQSAVEDRLSPVWPNTIPILCHSHWTVDHILLVVASILRSVYHMHISRSCLRLRKCGFGEPTPGPVLDTALSLSNFYNPHQCLMVQLLSDNPAHCSQMSPECVPKANASRTTLAALATTGYVFVRRWYPASLTFDSEWYEVVFPVGADRAVRWTVLVNWICTHSGLTADRLSIARCNFPGVSSRRHMYSSSILTSGPVLTWHSGASFDHLLSPVPNNGQVVYYKDIEEDYTHCDCGATCLSPLRLRKCGFGEPTPGPVLDTALSLSNFYNPHQCLMVQLLSDNPAHCSQMSPECVPKANASRTTLAALATTGYVFVRRWYPASLTFDSEWYEVVFPVGADRAVRWTVLVNWICTHSGLTADRLSIARCNFPGVSSRRHMYSSSILTSGPVLTWHSGASFDHLLSPVPNNGQVVYYKWVNSDGHLSNRTDGIESMLSSDSFPCSQNFPLAPPVFGPELPCSQNYPGITTSSSHDSMLTFTRSYDYEQPLRIYTAEDVLPSTSTRPFKGDQSSTTRPCTLRPSKPRESLTP